MNRAGKAISLLMLLGVIQMASADEHTLQALIVTGQMNNNRLRGPAENLAILATAFSPENQRGTGRHEPMLMTIRYGRGRVFHTVLGHGPEQLKSVAFIAMYQRGAEWAATGKVTQPVPDDFPGPDQPSIRQ